MEGKTAYVLAGGKSLRMGSDKAFAVYEGRTLLQRALDAIGKVTPDCRIVGTRGKFEVFGRVVEDVYPDRGPLGGIDAALKDTATDLNLILAVDLPHVSSELLFYLVQEAHASTAMVTLPRTLDGWQPLCAVYRKGFGLLTDAALREGRNAVHTLIETCAPRVIDEAELQAAKFSARVFRNVNTSADLA
jgi:molybdopterin-guanine dinucleotide biosynthesis protein A